MGKALPGQPQAKPAGAPPTPRVPCLPAVPAPPVACGPEATPSLIRPRHAGARGWRGTPSKAEQEPPTPRRCQVSIPGEPHPLGWSSQTVSGNAASNCLGRKGWGTGLHILCSGCSESQERAVLGQWAQARLLCVCCACTARTSIWALQCPAQPSSSFPLQLCVPTALPFAFLW